MIACSFERCPGPRAQNRSERKLISWLGHCPSAYQVSPAFAVGASHVAVETAEAEVLKLREGSGAPEK